MRNASKQRPFIYNDDLKQWEVICMLIYAVLSIAVILVLILAEPKTKHLTIFGYVGISQFGLYMGLYTSLRNFKSYQIWFGFGVFHAILYLIFGEDTALEMDGWNPAVGLVYTIVLLLLFQLLRYISLKIQHREFVVPTRGGGPDLFEDKKVTLLDFTLFVIYISSFCGLQLIGNII